MATHGLGKIMYNYASLAKKVVEDRYVVFGVTQDPESQEVEQLLRDNHLDHFCSRSGNPVMQYEALEFLQNREITSPGDEFTSMVNGEEIRVSNAGLIRIFILRRGKISPAHYREEDDDKIR